MRIFEGRENCAYRVLFESGDAKNYLADSLSIEEHIDDKRSINVWEYLNEVAEYNVIPVDDKEEKTVSLADKYKKMEFVAKNSLLEAYLNINTYSEAAGSPRERVRNVSATSEVSRHPPGEKRVSGDSSAAPREIQFVIRLNPVTKKNSQRIIKCGSYHRIMPSKAYVQYEKDARQFLPHRGEKLHRKCEIVGLFYMKTRRKVDLTNLLESLDDILVAHGVLEDDNSRIIVSHDGSRVLHDPVHPRTEVTIRFLEREEISLFDTE